MSRTASRVCLALVALLSACGDAEPEPAAESADPRAERAEPAVAPLDWQDRYVGAQRCAGCHAEQHRAWRGSPHDRAMEEASADTVLGDFADAALEAGGTRHGFQERDGRFVVHTAGADGTPGDFEIAYTFGFDPLQQYLVEFPDGRLQPLQLVWDARAAAEGGQRWFHLQGDAPPPPGDAFHWTGRAQTWNTQCADCHSTGLRKGYDPATDRHATDWAELDVACEACHGPGLDHLRWARTPAPREPVPHAALQPLGVRPRFERAAGAPIAQRVGPLQAPLEVEACAPCHARRTRIRQPEGDGRLLASHIPALLEQDLYFADGQIREEVYVYGSFLQSAMYREGVTCSHCHEPHSLALREEGNALCASCHDPAAFDVPAHTLHPAASAGARCVECHMPARNYMQVDPRRDHAFGIPRPDLSADLGTPHACAACHAERDAAWAAGVLQRAFGPPDPHFGQALHAARTDAVDAEAQLLSLAGDPGRAAIVRATAFRELARHAGPASLPVIAAGLEDPEPLVQLGAIAASEGLPLAARLRLAAPLLSHPLAGVRVEAARALVSVPTEAWPPAAKRDFIAALADYRAAQRHNADRPEARVNLGALHARFDELDPARAEYAAALRLDPDFTPARVNLADVERQAGKDAEAAAILEEAVVRDPDSAEAHHALGLARVRLGQMPEAVDALARALALAPGHPGIASVYALALHESGAGERALDVLRRAQEQRPGDPQLLLLLATLSRDLGDRAAAWRYAELLAEAAPGDPRARSLLEELSRPPVP